MVRVFYLVNPEGEWWQVVDGVEDVWEVVERRDLDAVLHTHHTGIRMGHSCWSSWLQQDLRGWYDPWKAAYPRGCHGLGVFGHRRFADDSKQGHDVESPAILVILAHWPPSLIVAALLRRHSQILNLVVLGAFGSMNRCYQLRRGGIDVSFRLLAGTKGYRKMKRICEMEIEAFAMKMLPSPVSLARLRLVVLVSMHLETIFTGKDAPTARLKL
jgi:hypothetical protein